MVIYGRIYTYLRGGFGMISLNKCILFLIGIFFSMGIVQAKTNVSYQVKDDIILGDDVVVNIVINDIAGEKIVGIGGQIDIDSEYLQYVSFASLTRPFEMWFNEQNGKMAGISFSHDGIIEDGAILELVLRPVKEGTTTLGFKNIELINNDAKKIDTQIVDKSINIGILKEDKIETVEIIEEQEEVSEEITKKENVKDSIMEVKRKKAVKFFKNIKGLFKRDEENIKINNSNVIGSFIKKLFRR
jgi:hypothetical protein